MTPSRAERSRSEAASLDEVRGLLIEARMEPKRRWRKCDIRRELIRSRRFDLPQTGELSTAEAGFFLVLSRHSIGDRIRDRRLPARRVERQDGNGFVYLALCEDVRAMVEKELKSS